MSSYKEIKVNRINHIIDIKKYERNNMKERTWKHETCIAQKDVRFPLLRIFVRPPNTLDAFPPFLPCSNQRILMHKEE